MPKKSSRKTKSMPANRPKAKRKPIVKPAPNRAKHPWRVCPVGQHYRSGSFVDDYTTGAGELQDHYLDLSEDDMLDPNLAICAGVRWLFRKKELEEVIRKHPISWREAIIKYKSLRPRTIARDRDLIDRFDGYLKQLKRKKGKK